MSELKPCPFCGSTDWNLHYDCMPYWYRFYCKKCKSTGPRKGEIEDAKVAWNNRPNNKEKDLLIEVREWATIDLPKKWLKDFDIKFIDRIYKLEKENHEIKNK